MSLFRFPHRVGLLHTVPTYLFFMSSNEFLERSRKAKTLREKEINPYPSRFEEANKISELIQSVEAKPPRSLDDILASRPYEDFRIRGRLMTIREHGKLTFAHLKDDSGHIQICFMENELGKEQYKLLKLLDMGDFLGASGELFFTKHGQLTLLVSKFIPLGKTLRPLPEKWHGLQDQEAIYRQRYLDLLMNEDSMKRFRMRSEVVEIIRQYLLNHGFIEVETPILAAKASGATAKPFHTHHNALDIELTLRIAPETYLKRCIVGGFERVFEFARCFRNEGMDPSHLQEFTMLEYYVAYWNYEDNMAFTEELFSYLLEKLFGTLQIHIKTREGSTELVDFSPPWPRLPFRDLILKHAKIDIFDYFEDEKGLRQAIKKAKIQIDDLEKLGFGNLCDALYKKTVRPHLIQPVFVTEHPALMKPLARRSDTDPRICESFQLLVSTWEIINAYSELVDPEDQRERFIEQARAKLGGDEEAMEMDLDYLRAMEHGMPPMSGWGMGVDRLVSLLLGQDNLKDVVLFPLLRPLEEDIKAEKKIREKLRKKKK